MLIDAVQEELAERELHEALTELLRQEVSTSCGEAVTFHVAIYCMQACRVEAQ